MSKVSFVDKYIKTSTAPIHLVRCKDLEGRDCYYFIMSSPQKIKMLKDVTEGTFDINDYGKIIASGFGTEPSDHVKKQLKDQFDFDAGTLLNS